MQIFLSGPTRDPDIGWRSAAVTRLSPVVAIWLNDTPNVDRATRYDSILQSSAMVCHYIDVSRSPFINDDMMVAMGAGVPIFINVVDRGAYETIWSPNDRSKFHRFDTIDLAVGAARKSAVGASDPPSIRTLRNSLRVCAVDPDLPFVLPTRSHSTDCGYDLHVSADYQIPVGGYADVHHNVAVELPPDTWGLLVGRSSAYRNLGLMVMTGIIDNGYRGPLLAVAYNQSDTIADIKIGDRLAQLILIPMLTPPVVQVDQLSDTDRGDQGYGSTGR